MNYELIIVETDSKPVEIISHRIFYEILVQTCEKENEALWY